MGHYGYKIRIYPNAEQRRLIQINLDARRFVYNHFLAPFFETAREVCGNPETSHAAHINTAASLTKVKVLAT